MHDEILALVRKQFTAEEIAIKLGCIRADVYAAINGPEIEFVADEPIIEGGTPAHWLFDANGEAKLYRACA